MVLPAFRRAAMLRVAFLQLFYSLLASFKSIIHSPVAVLFCNESKNTDLYEVANRKCLLFPSAICVTP